MSRPYRVSLARRLWRCSGRTGHCMDGHVARLRVESCRVHKTHTSALQYLRSDTEASFARRKCIVRWQIVGTKQSRISD